jgi:hypothetical protein
MEGYATARRHAQVAGPHPEWDLNWQGVFLCKEPVYLPRGTVILMRYHYDNSADNVQPQQAAEACPGRQSS